MLVLYAGLALAVVVLASAIGVYVYARRKAAVQATAQCEHERRRRAVLDDFGDGAVWQMGQRATNAIGSGVPAGPLVTRRGFLPRMAVSFLIVIAGRSKAPALGLLLSDPSPAQSTDSVSYQGVTLQPGDIVNFVGGGATVLDFLHYGHAALYLGVDPQTHQRTFLDFTTTKGGVTEYVFGSPQPFFGRILNEKDFFNANVKAHKSFDVFRLKGSPPINQTAMLKEAKRISNTESWGFSGEVCSSAVAAVLSKATCTAAPCTKIKGFTPDDLTTGQFERNPDLKEGQSIEIRAALREAERAQADRDHYDHHDLPPPHHDHHDLPPPHHDHLDTPHGDSGGLSQVDHLGRVEQES